MSALADCLLRLEDVTLNFGGLCAIDKVSVSVNEGELIGLIGSNGAGKSSLYNCITGVNRVTSGRVFFRNEDISGLAPHQVAAKGLIRSFQLVAVFPDLTCLENVMAGFHMVTRAGVLDAIFHTTLYKREVKECTEKGYKILKKIGLEKNAHTLARKLSYGDRKRLDIGRAIATSPKLLMLDEPAAGLNPAERVSLADLVRQLNSDGHSLIVIEHDMKLVMGLVQRVLVLERGKLIADGAPCDIQRNEKVITAYLKKR